MPGATAEQFEYYLNSKQSIWGHIAQGSLKGCESTFPGTGLLSPGMNAQLRESQHSALPHCGDKIFPRIPVTVHYVCCWPGEGKCRVFPRALLPCLAPTNRTRTTCSPEPTIYSGLCPLPSSWQTGASNSENAQTAFTHAIYSF